MPLAQDGLVHVFQIIPVWYAILRLQAGYGEGSRWIFAGEDWTKRMLASLSHCRISLPYQWGIDAAADVDFIRLRAVPKQWTSREWSSYRDNILLVDMHYFVKHRRRCPWLRWAPAWKGPFLEHIKYQWLRLAHRFMCNHLLTYVPSHLLSSSNEIGSSFGGLSSTGILGAKLLGSV